MTVADDKHTREDAADDDLARDLAAFTGQPVRKIRKTLRKARKREHDVACAGQITPDHTNGSDDRGVE